MSAEDSNIIIISSCSPPSSQPPLPCRECFCFHQNHKTAPTQRQRPRSPTQSAGCAHVQKVKPESSLCSPTCAGSFMTCDSGHSRTGTKCDRKTIINPLLQEDETNPDEIYLGRIKKQNKRALIAEGCVAPPVEFPSLFAQEQTFPSHLLAQFLLRVGCEMQTQHDREAPAEDE